MNKELLERVAQHIEAEPRRLQMSSWVEASPKSPCGTTACIAGWAVLLTAPDFDAALDVARTPTLDDEGADDSWAHEARVLRTVGREDEDFDQAGRELLGIDRQQADRLFYMIGWPAEFVSGYDGRNAAEAARIAAARIRHFIATDGAE